MLESSGQPPSISLISLGCPRTLVDSERHLGRLKRLGYHISDDVEGSDVVVINTCSFIQEAIKESVDTILQAVALKKQGRIKAVVVAGCLVQRFKRDLLKELSEVDGFVGLNGSRQLEEVIQRVLRKGHIPGFKRLSLDAMHALEDVRSPLGPSHYAYLKISEGCLKGCSFCIIPKIKGRLRSRTIEELAEESRRLVEERAITELIVVGQDTSDYGVDIYKKSRIADLLALLAKIRGLNWIRLLYCHPQGVSPELICTIRDEPKICKYLDMAIEHADDKVLRLMNRSTSRAYLKDTILKLRQGIPGISLRSSVIVGFPGETEAAFENLLQFLAEVRFERLGAFEYSREEGTAAFRYPDQIPDVIRRKRFKRLMQMQQDISSALNAALVGRICDVMIDEADPTDSAQFLGRTSADCPDVDGEVFVKSSRRLIPGDIVTVKFTDSLEYDLVGTVEDNVRSDNRGFANR